MTRTFKSFLIIPALLLLLTAGYFLYAEEQGNFHAITPGEAYRSGQLDRDELKYYINKHHIKSIINLRGKNPGTAWYMEELKVSAENGAAHFDLPLSASHEPGEEDVRKLMEIFMQAPRPVLIHCQGGADRSGLAAAMWKVIVDKEPKAEAGKQLSILYEHIPIGKTSAMDSFFRKWNYPAVSKAPIKLSSGRNVR